VGQNLQDHVTTLVGPFTMKARGFLVDRDVNLESLNKYNNEGAGKKETVILDVSESS